MRHKITALLGFPYAKEYEDRYNQYVVRTMYKPLLIAVAMVLLLSGVLIVSCVLAPEQIGPPQAITGLIYIHSSLFAATLLAIIAAVLLRRTLFLHPCSYLVLCNSYAVAICFWSSVLSAWTYYSPIVFTSVVYVSLIVSLAAQAKPWQSVLVFLSNFAVYVVALHIFVPPDQINAINIMNAGLAATLSIAIAFIVYRYRTGNFYNRLVILEQNEEISRINKQLVGLVHTDELTGLYNRRYFDEIMPQKYEKLLRDGGTACVMMFDVDNFKQYNDLYGHPEGDNCLRRVMQLARERLPGGDCYFARYGGEEFILLAPVAGLEAARCMAQAICSHVEGGCIPHLASKYGVVTVSVGFAVCGSRNRVSLIELSRRADEALYQAKDRGRNCVFAYTTPPFFAVAEK